MIKVLSIFILIATISTSDSSVEKTRAAIQSAKRSLKSENSCDFYQACNFHIIRKKVTRNSLKMERRNAIMERAMKALMDGGYEAGKAYEQVSRTMAHEDEELGICANTPIRCDQSHRFRTIDGRCNNLANPYWGSVGVKLKREVKAKYGNSDSSPATQSQFKASRGCTKSGSLPNVRKVSSDLHSDSNIPSTLATHMLTQMGQFLDHDLTLTPESHVEHCCDEPGQAECLPIQIPSSDSFYSPLGQTCLELTRSVKYCNTSPREQFNDITAFLDASNVYGSTASVLASLRVPESYLMKVTPTASGKELLPKNTNGHYFAGDIRAIEMPGLASMHNLLVREHNRVARLIANQSPKLTNEQVFQNARRIVGAEMQNVVYGQYLEAILGSNTMSTQNLKLRYPSRYDSSVDPSITNAFATAAFRFGHSMIRAEIQRVALTASGTNTSYSLKDIFFKTENYDANDGQGMEEVLFGLIHQPSQGADRFTVDDLTNLLFNDGKKFGQDLIARNLQRSRDHGLATYGDFLQVCGFKPLCTWDDKPNDISKASWEILKSLYTSPNDIDLFAAGLAEQPISGTALGKTFNCLISRQFKSLKDGDRFFFTHNGQAGSFNAAQANNILTRNLGQILCDNTGIQKVRSNVFDLSSEFQDCPSSSTLNIRLFGR